MFHDKSFFLHSMISEGVVGKLKKYIANENLIITHCLSYRVNLGAKDLWKNDKTLNGFNSILHLLCRCFNKSSKRTIILEEEELLSCHLKLLTPIDIRWMSIYKVIERIYLLYPALISALKKILVEESCIIAEGLLRGNI